MISQYTITRTCDITPKSTTHWKNEQMPSQEWIYKKTNPGAL